MIDVSHDAYMARMAVVEAMGFISAPHSRLPVSVFPDGNQWCCLYGEDLAVGVAGFGDTPANACEAFDKAWRSEKPPIINRTPSGSSPLPESDSADHLGVVIGRKADA